MKLTPQFTFHGLERSPAIEAKALEYAQRLDRFADRIMGCRVDIEQTAQHHHQGRMYRVRIDLTVPGGEVVVDRDAGLDHRHEDVYVALHDAFEAARRRLEDRERTWKTHREQAGVSREHGEVARVFADEGYGFITAADGTELYFHRNSLSDGDWQRLDIGAEVRFTRAEGEKGPHARLVTLVGPAGGQS
ncbi:MAG TPA: HPF/RaiA family ribosome-associated protein [Alphaproteobacteria bacterium]|jgi:cold shock CspA family protein|nr:HPF/RaiA family ribosome-associated protein [Alphaproteobacteria bacterium]